MNKYSNYSFLRITVLENPNAQGLIELYVHTIPLFGQFSLVFERVLETVQRCLKLVSDKHIP